MDFRQIGTQFATCGEKEPPVYIAHGLIWVYHAALKLAFAIYLHFGDIIFRNSPAFRTHFGWMTSQLKVRTYNPQKITFGKRGIGGRYSEGEHRSRARAKDCHPDGRSEAGRAAGNQSRRASDAPEPDAKAVIGISTIGYTYRDKKMWGILSNPE